MLYSLRVRVFPLSEVCHLSYVMQGHAPCGRVQEHSPKIHRYALELLQELLDNLAAQRLRDDCWIEGKPSKYADGILLI